MIKKLLFAALLLAYLNYTEASEIGASFSVPLIPKDPVNLHGYRAAITYNPKALEWKHWEIYFDASFGHWYIPQGPYSSLNTYAIAPYFRFYLARSPFVSPFLEASIGPTFLSKTRLGKYNQGMHFAFQDQATIGAAFGAKQQFYLSLSALHYSNGSMSSANSGITVYTVLNAGYRF